MRIEIICTGDEVLTGKIVNTNFSYMAQKLEDFGLSVGWGTIVGDDREELLAARFDIAGMAKLIGVDTLAFVSIDGLYRAMGEPRRDRLAPRFCDACFTGELAQFVDEQPEAESAQDGRPAFGALAQDREQQHHGSQHEQAAPQQVGDVQATAADARKARQL